VESGHLLGGGSVYVGDIGLDLAQVNRRRLLVSPERANDTSFCVVSALIDMLAQAALAFVNVFAQASPKLIQPLIQSSFDSLQDFAKFVCFHWCIYKLLYFSSGQSVETMTISKSLFGKSFTGSLA